MSENCANEFHTFEPREHRRFAKQLLYIERYMKLLAPKWEAISDLDLFVHMVNIVNEAEADREQQRG